MAVRLSQAFHVSGYRSVELRDVAGDGTMPELQGYFPERRDGRLYFHFAFLTTNPEEELNVALAGPRWFQHEKDGISFWLATREGRLVQVSAGAERSLFAVEAFVWYAVDVAYDLAAGAYDLTIHREGVEAALVALRGQPNAVGKPGSAVDKFSFVGSPYTDRSNVVYYVDDVVIGSDRGVARLPFAAPGRRKLFVDLFNDYRRQLQGRPRCLPPSAPEELGLNADDLFALARDGRLDALQQALAGGPPRALAVHGEARERVLGAVSDWSAGCRALESGDAAGAQALFTKAATAVPEGWIYRLSSVLALAGLKRFAEADELLLSLADGRDDPRYAVASAYVGIARGDLDRAEQWLRDPASRVLSSEANPLLQLYQRGLAADVLDAVRGRLGEAAFRERLEETLVTEQYYYVLLWQSQYEPARDYAARMDARLARAGVGGGLWASRAGDACFYLRDLARARELYRAGDRGREGLRRAPRPLPQAGRHCLPRRRPRHRAALPRALLRRAARVRRRRGAACASPVPGPPARPLAAEEHYPDDITPPAGTRYPCALTALPRALPGIPEADRAYVNRTYTRILRATQAKLVMLKALDEGGDLGGALARYRVATSSLAERLRAEPAPSGLAPFQDDVSQALALQQAFFAKAVPLREAGRTMAEVYAVPEGRQASSRLVSAWARMQARYPSWSRETSDSIYHHLCALDLF